MSNPFEDLTLCWAGYASCEVVWPAVEVLAATLVGAISLFAAIAARRTAESALEITKQQRADQVSRAATDERASAIWCFAVCGTLGLDVSELHANLKSSLDDRRIGELHPKAIVPEFERVTDAMQRAAHQLAAASKGSNEKAMTALATGSMLISIAANDLANVGRSCREHFEGLGKMQEWAETAIRVVGDCNQVVEKVGRDVIHEYGLGETLLAALTAAKGDIRGS